MTIRTFWLIFLKIIGLFMIPKLAQIVMLLLAELPNYEGDENHFVNMLILSVISFCIYLAVLFVLVFKTNKVIDVLHLEKGFSETRLDINYNSTVVLKIVTIVIGGIYVSETFPWICTSLVNLIKEDDGFSFPTKSDSDIFQFIIGVLLIVFSSKIAALIDKKANES